MTRTLSLVLAGATAIGLSAGAVQAAPMPALTSTLVGGDNGNLAEVRYRGRGYYGGGYGRGYGGYGRGYGYRRGNVGGALAAGAALGIIGGAIAASQAPRYGYYDRGYGYYGRPAYGYAAPVYGGYYDYGY